MIKVGSKVKFVGSTYQGTTLTNNPPVGTYGRVISLLGIFLQVRWEKFGKNYTDLWCGLQDVVEVKHFE